MHKPSAIICSDKPPQLAQVDFDQCILSSKKDYQKQLEDLQKTLIKVQQSYYHQGRRAIIVFEGWDASGKGGAIRRLTEKLDPRGYDVYPIAAPTADEQGRHYLYRFQTRLPPPGKLAIFDRSYYGRVLVERVEGFADDQQWQRAYQEINEFERQLIDDGARIIKLFLHITPAEQLKRFSERLNNPYKRWKLTSEDIRNREKWPDYEVAIDDMLRYTSTTQTAWHLIAANHKWFARVEVLKAIVQGLSEQVSIEPPPINKQVVADAEAILGITLENKP